jgi:hypothetical protein
MESIATWVAPIATTIAALMTASNLGSRVTGYGFVVFTVGSIAWLTLGIVTGQPNLLWQNAILTALNLFGIWRWLGRQARLEEGGRQAQESSEDLPGEDLFPISTLTRANLIADNGEELGSAVDAMAGCGSGGVRYLVVSSGGVGGVGEVFRRVDWNHVGVTSDTIRFAGPQSRFAALPTVEKDQWPAR